VNRAFHFVVLTLALASAHPDTSCAAPPGGPVAMTWLGGRQPPEDRPKRHIPMPAGNPAGAVVRLERSGCYGDCPIYTVEVHGNGDVVYQGSCHVLVVGHHQWRIEPAEVVALMGQVRAADFWSLKRRYAAPITDNATYRLTVTVGGHTKTLEDYVGVAAGMPKAVSALEDAVDHLAGTDRWLVGDTSTIASLQAEGWDFHSAEAAQTLARAAAKAPEEVALRLLALGAPPVSAPSASDCYPQDESSAVAAAAEQRRLTLLNALIAAGAFQQAGSKEDALFGAVASGDPAIVNAILEHHPNINARISDDDDTPILWVSQGPQPFFEDDAHPSDYPLIIRLLVAAGADPSSGDRDGNTPLHEILDADAAKALIAAGAPLEARNKAGETPLLATYDEDVALALIDAGADIGARTPDGTGLRDVALTHKWPRVLARLIASR
jgi:hypothetical protein